ncbi:MAG: type II secretion system F family protein [Minisyncoccia bacterium]|jgi:type IV pilus assembly protein PilC
MLYHYVAVDRSGETQEADFNAGTLDDVLHYLSGKELRPISVKALTRDRFGAPRFWGGINTSDEVFLTKYLALMLRVGTDLLSAVNILISDFDKPSVKDFLLEVYDSLSRGQPFYESFARHPEIFSPTFVNLVKAAEISGNLQKTFEDLSVSLEREAELKSRIRAALVYPVVVLCMAAAILTFLVTFALPQLAAAFSGGGINAPLFSRIVFSVGLFVGANIVPIYAILLTAIIVCVVGARKTETGKRILHRILANLPVIRKVYNDLGVQRMASTISSLIKAGLPIIETITVAAETVNHRDYQYALMRVANDGLAKGLTLGESFKREAVFPKTLSNLIAISEKAGHLDEVLATLADFYGANTDSNIQTLVSLLEPVLLLGMGLIVAVIALSIIVPIYQLTSSF